MPTRLAIYPSRCGLQATSTEWFSARRAWHTNALTHLCFYFELKAIESCKLTCFTVTSLQLVDVMSLDFVVLLINRVAKSSGHYNCVYYSHQRRRHRAQSGEKCATKLHRSMEESEDWRIHVRQETKCRVEGCDMRYVSRCRRDPCTCHVFIDGARLLTLARGYKDSSGSLRSHVQIVAKASVITLKPPNNTREKWKYADPFSPKSDRTFFMPSRKLFSS